MTFRYFMDDLATVIERKRYLALIARPIKHYPVVALLGPRQIGKMTLARQFMADRPARYFDLESDATQDLLRQPAAVIDPLTGLVVIDEVQRLPALFPLLEIDARDDGGPEGGPVGGWSCRARSPTR